MDQMILILAFFLFILSETIIFYIFFSGHKANNVKKEKRVKSDVDKIKILLEDKALEKIDDVIDGLIKAAVDRYMVLNVNFNTEAYLNDDSIKELTLYTFGSVKKNMTPTVIGLIGLINDISTEEKLDEYLELKIKMYLLAVVVKTNQ